MELFKKKFGKKTKYLNGVENFSNMVEILNGVENSQWC